MIATLIKDYSQVILNMEASSKGVNNTAGAPSCRGDYRPQSLMETSLPSLNELLMQTERASEHRHSTQIETKASRRMDRPPSGMGRPPTLVEELVTQ